MADVKNARQRRRRGRPRVRPDCETRQVIYEAVRREFAAGGYRETSMESVAHRAGLSTKTLYRLFPNKAALLEGTMSDRLDRLLSGFFFPPGHGSPKPRGGTVYGADNMCATCA